MVTRYDFDNGPGQDNAITEHLEGQYVRYEDYARVVEALKPFAEKWLYPDDLEEPYVTHIREDEDYDQAKSDETLDDCWIKRGWIRAARLALKL